METKRKPVMSEAARKERKRLHLARIAAKGQSNYAELYAAQPAQRRKAAQLAIEEQRRQDALAAVDLTLITEASEAAELFSGASPKEDKK